MAISTAATTPAHGWRAALGKLGRGISWLFRLIGTVALGVLTGIGFYVLATLSGWAAGLGCLLLLTALVRRWLAARRAAWNARLARAEPLLWTGTLTAGVGALILMAWRSPAGVVWLLLGIVGLGLMTWMKFQSMSAGEKINNNNDQLESGWWITRDGKWLLKAQVRKALGLPNIFSVKFGRSSKS